MNHPVIIMKFWQLCPIIKKLIENPRQKIRGLNMQAIILTVIALVFLVIFTILYIQDQSYTLYLAVAFVSGIIYNILINRRVFQS